MGMRTEGTSSTRSGWGEEAPGGKIARAVALGAAVGLSALVVIALVVNPASGVSGWLGLSWMISIITCITVYTVGSVFFRRSTMAPSRRMERWLRSGSRTTATTAESNTPEPAAEEDEESVAVLVDLTQDASAPTTSTSANSP